MKVFELAKNIGVTSKEILKFLKQKEISVKNHLSILDDEAVKLIESTFSKESAASKKETKKKQTSKKRGPKKTTAESKTIKGKKDTKKKQRAPKKTSFKVKKEVFAVGVEKKAKEETVSQVVKKRKRIVKPRGKEPQETVSAVTPPPKVSTKKPDFIQIKIPITVGGLATNLFIKTSELIKTLMGMGIFATVNQRLDEDIVMKIAERFNVRIEKLPSEEEKLIQEHEKEDDEADLVGRPPIVTMMGHVDHGKTSLLDAIRSSHVVDREAGKITQHVGAYEVSLPNKGKVTFLDTPGHSAFTAMRSRGAHLTDIVVLVVAADDGVMPQTIEAINHAKAAETPIVVAINKSDLSTANPDKVKSGLQKQGLMPEDWGGKTIMVNVSAKTGKGIDELLELLLLEAEILELKANPNRLAQGTVVEGKLSKSLGSVAHVLVQNGTLHVGDIVVCGRYYGKVRSMHNDKGKNVKDATPSTPVEITGINGVLDAGERFYVVNDEWQARSITEKRLLEIKEKNLGSNVRHLSLEGLYDMMKESGVKELKIIIKADVQGSVEVLRQSLEKLSTDKIKLKVIHGAAGGINESDVVLAVASDAVIIGFHVKADSNAQAMIERERVDVKYYKVIYEAINSVKLAMEGLLEPTIKEVVLGSAEVTQIFKASRIGNIGGCMVRKGKLVRNQRVRLIRENIVIYEGKFHSLRRFKDDVKEVNEGYECGVVIENYNDIKVGDIIECFKEEKVAAKL